MINGFEVKADMNTGEVKFSGDINYKGNLADPDFIATVGLTQLKQIEQKRIAQGIPDNTNLTEDIAAYEYMIKEHKSDEYCEWKSKQKANNSPRHFHAESLGKIK